MALTSISGEDYKLPMSNFVYIGTSIDGRISSSSGTLDWMETVPNPDGNDLGFFDFVARVDAIVMGRVTFETIIEIGLGWHYPLPGIILSSTMDTAPEGFAEHVQFAKGTPAEIVALAKRQGFTNLYIDGGNTIQRFLRVDLIDELIITELPILLGGGDRLFDTHDQEMKFELLSSEVLLGQMVKRHYRRTRVEG